MGEDGSTVCEISTTLRAIIETNGFRINEGKTRLRHREIRQEVTGLIVNRRVNVKRRVVRQIRAMLHAWTKFGLAKAQAAFKEEYGELSDFESAVRGKIEFVAQIRERPDPVFRKLADQFNKLTAGGKIRTELTPDEVIRQAIWVVEHDGDEQGTAFYLKEYGFVTCAHCVGQNMFIYHPADPATKLSVNLIKSDEHRDLAVLSVPDELKGLMPIRLYDGFAALSPGSDLILCGYPQHHLAMPIRIEHGKLIRSFPKNGVSYLEITPKIMAGNSGGPVLNAKSEVIGIAVSGLAGTVEFSQAVFLAVAGNELKSLQ
jgi:RNA-directed DNA polymerase